GAVRRGQLPVLRLLEECAQPGHQFRGARLRPVPPPAVLLGEPGAEARTGPPAAGPTESTGQAGADRATHAAADSPQSGKPILECSSNLSVRQEERRLGHELTLSSAAPAAGPRAEEPAQRGST